MGAERIRLNKMHHPVVALGPGRRIGLWLQGCHVGCHGCLSLDTWEADDSRFVPVVDVITAVLDAIREDPTLTGITISGGEPTEQAVAVIAILDGVHRSLPELTTPIDVLLYSGLTWRRLSKQHPGLLARVDAVIPEPFVAAKAPGGRWRGSSNQPLLLLTELARERYDGADDVTDPEFQVVVHDGRLWTIGVPRPGDLDRVLAIAEAHGVTVTETSWRA